MYNNYYDHDRIEAQQKLEYQKERFKEWEKLRETEQRLFIAVFKAWRRNKSEGRWNQADELGEWVTREQIADELDAFRLTPYNLKLLDHLSQGKRARLINGKPQGSIEGLHWVQKAKRTRWRRTWENKKRPAGYEWVYYPSEDVIAALNAMNPNNQKPEATRPVPVLPAVPKYKPPFWERIVDKVFDLLP